MSSIHGNDDPGDDWVFDPELSAVERRIRNEFRQEAEAVEADVNDADLRERHFYDVANDMHNRGDVVIVATSRRSFSGQVVYSARDLITVRTESFEVDISLLDVAYIKVIRRGTNGGKPIKLGPGTFEMRLMQRRSPADRIELGYRNIDDTVIGRLIAVGQDHVVLIDDHKQEWTITLDAIAWVIRRDRRPR